MGGESGRRSASGGAYQGVNYPTQFSNTSSATLHLDKPTYNSAYLSTNDTSTNLKENAKYPPPLPSEQKTYVARMANPIGPTISPGVAVAGAAVVAGAGGVGIWAASQPSTSNALLGEVTSGPIQLPSTGFAQNVTTTATTDNSADHQAAAECLICCLDCLCEVAIEAAANRE